MAQVTFTGIVSAQAALGETVTVTVTKPDATTEPLITTTLTDRTYSVTKQYMVAGAYKAKAHIDADAIYLAADSTEVSFTVTLTARALTLNVTLA